LIEVQRFCGLVSSAEFGYRSHIDLLPRNTSGIRIL
jgi:hypothetical protein